MEKTMPILEIAIPVCNEETRICNGIQKIASFLKATHLENTIRITIIDNGSTDQTHSLALQLLQQYPSFKFLSIQKKGLGLALKTVWMQSQAEVVGYMDIDLATNINHLHDVLAAFLSPHCCMVNGSRYLPSSQIMNRRLFRSCLSITFNFFLKKILKVTFTDGMCGFKFIRKSCYLQIQSLGIPYDGLFFSTELLYKAEKQKLLIQEIPVHWTDDRDSHIRVVQTIFYFMIAIIKLRLLSDSKK